MSDYDAFYLGFVRVTQASESQFMVHGTHVPGGCWIVRGQVHLESDMDPDVSYGERGHLTVTEWFARSRNLRRAPVRRKT